MNANIMFGALPNTWSSFIVVHGVDPNLYIAKSSSKLKQNATQRRKPNKYKHHRGIS